MGYVKTEHRYPGYDDGGKQILEDFKNQNPQLLPVERNSPGAECAQLWHIASVHHRNEAALSDIHCCSKMDRGGFMNLLDHNETWQDWETGDLLNISHPYGLAPIDEENRDLEKAIEISNRQLDYAKELASARGLDVAFGTSWYDPQTALAVIARPRTLERVYIDGQRNAALKELSDWDALEVIQPQLALEQVRQDRWVSEAQDLEANGDYYKAMMYYGDTSWQERTGEFHRQAVAMLRECGRLLREHPLECMELAVARSSWNVADTRRVFKFAGMNIPKWIEQTWNRGRKQSNGRWGSHYDRDTGKSTYRCCVCGEWGNGQESGTMTRRAIGIIHTDNVCMQERIRETAAMMSNGQTTTA